jgi:hypothetical protein
VFATQLFSTVGETFPALNDALASPLLSRAACKPAAPINAAAAARIMRFSCA